MSDSNISFSKEIANTIGLEEAIILEYIKKTENSTDGISITQITSDIKFWSYQTIEEVLSSLIKTGLIIESTVENELYFSSKKPNLNKNSIPENKWKPNKEILDQINEYGIPEDFAQLQIDDFKQLNLEKSDEEINWGVKFLRFVIKKWRYKEVEDNKRKKTKPMHKNWMPDTDARSILLGAGIDENFINNEIPEFILYWSERNEESDIWNSKFIAHIRRQWGRFKDVSENHDRPSKMSSAWNPNEDFYDILELTEIPRDFAESLIPEFIMYWKETGQALTSWNSKFLQHVKYHWEKTNKGQTPQLSKQIDKRIESSWKIQEEDNSASSIKPDNSILQENFKKLKEKHQI